MPTTKQPSAGQRHRVTNVEVLLAVLVGVMLLILDWASPWLWLCLAALWLAIVGHLRHQGRHHAH